MMVRKLSLLSAAVEAEPAMNAVRRHLVEATEAKKCHSCGCFHQTVSALEATEPGHRELGDVLQAARATFVAKRHDCLGCEVCFPALAANAFAERYPELGEGLDLCPTSPPAEREGWPPLPGDYHALRYDAPVAVCTLSAAPLAQALAKLRPEGLSIVGTLHTENLGIERIIQNVLANPSIRVLVLCGEEALQAVGHLAGQSLVSLVQNGIDERGRIVGARGKRPVLRNVQASEIEAFRQQISLVDRRGTTDEHALGAQVSALARTAPGPIAHGRSHRALPRVQARAPARLTPDPAGYLVVYPEPRTHRLMVEHFSNDGLLTVVIEGETPAAVYAEVIARGLLTRLDHAAYLGRELGRAEHALKTGEPYVQDRAAGVEAEASEGAVTASGAQDRSESHSCGCSGGCGGAS